MSQRNAPTRPVFVFAPGAGAPSTHPWMRRWVALLGTIGAVHAFDYGYMLAGRKRPDPLPKLIAAHRAAWQEARRSHAGPAVLIGKSMGSRVGCHLALEENVPAIICLGYPLCGGGDPTKLRDVVLRALGTPTLLVQGTRDSLCPLKLLGEVRRKMTGVNELHVVQGGDHSLLVSKSQLKADHETQEDVDERVLRTIERFVAKHAGSDAPRPGAA